MNGIGVLGVLTERHGRQEKNTMSVDSIICTHYPGDVDQDVRLVKENLANARAEKVIQP